MFKKLLHIYTFFFQIPCRDCQAVQRVKYDRLWWCYVEGSWKWSYRDWDATDF